MSCRSSGSSDERWEAIPVDLDALHKIVCEIFRIPPSQCGPPVRVGLHGRYARVFSFQLPTRKVVARLVYPIKPLFKTEGEVAAMDFVRGHTSLPVPNVFSYCSEATNPVGTEWLIMEYMPGVEMNDAWDTFGLAQKRKLALDLIDLHDQLYRLRADGCGSIYHTSTSVGDSSLQYKHPRAPRWAPLSFKSLSLLKLHCSHSVQDDYNLGPLNDIAFVHLGQPTPSPSQTMPVFSSEEYVSLLSLNGNPTTRHDFVLPNHKKIIELFQSIYKFYPNSRVYGPSATQFCFAHGDLHGGNILVDPQTGAITGIIDWELAAFRPLWTQSISVGWFDEDGHRFMFRAFPPMNFEYDTDPQDAELRAFFRVQMNKRNPDLFLASLGAIELRAVLDAGIDVPPPNGYTDIFVAKYWRDKNWNEDRRGPFPWDMMAWLWFRYDLDMEEMKREKLLSQVVPNTTE